jgi:hypothetical protein
MYNNNHTTCRVRCASTAANLRLQCNVTAFYRLGPRAVYELLCEVGALTGNMIIAFIAANTYCPDQTAGERSPASHGAGAMTPDPMSVWFGFLNRLGDLLSDATHEVEAAQELGVSRYTRETNIVRPNNSV